MFTGELEAGISQHDMAMLIATSTMCLLAAGLLIASRNHTTLLATPDPFNLFPVDFREEKSFANSI